jgi:predicted transcriptional regulator
VFFEDVTFSHFAVLENTVYIGSISADDIENFDADKKISEYKYNLEGFFVRINSNWLDVLEVFAKNDANVVPVLDENNSYVGYYNLEDVIKFFNETPFLKEKGAVIIVEKAILDYSFSQITQIIESNDGKILGLFVSHTAVENVQITIKIALGRINEIIQTFRRYDYQILSNHLEDNYLSSLKERSDYLEKYLNI